MNPASLWIEALRSGEYQQATCHLKHGNAYCCLGVACELYQKHVGGLEVSDLGPHRFYNNCDTILPNKVVSWLGLQCDEGSFFNDEGESETLHELNDGGYSFDKLADIIASRPPGLFAANMPEETEHA